MPDNLVDLPNFGNELGTLTVLEFGTTVPFPVARAFVVSGVPVGMKRGAHAHRDQHQFLVAVRGTVRVRLLNAQGWRSFVLSRPDRGLWLPPMHWGEQKYMTEDATLVVFCSGRYDRAGYVEDFASFRQMLADATPRQTVGIVA